MKRKWLAVGIILLMVGVTVVPTINFNTVKAQNTEKPLLISRGNWLYVGGSGPGNYTRIQDAIDNASEGDTVFVYDDSSPYYENLLINKSLNFIGENKETTIIDGKENGTCVFVLADRVRISGFTIQKSGYLYPGIQMKLSNNSTISSNILQNNTGPGIGFISTNNNTIKDNVIINNYEGIFARSGAWNLIDGNYICSNSGDGINLYAEGPNTISRNNISSNGYWGIYVFSIDTPGNNITGNYISNNPSKGILVSISPYVCISNNIISHSKTGIEVDDSTIIHNNNFLNNSESGITVTGSANSIFNNSFSNSGIKIARYSHNNINNNEINGKPLIYLQDTSNILIDNAGQITLVDCNNINMVNVDLSHTSIGLTLFNTNYCTISNSTISYNTLGVRIWFSGHNTFMKNNFIKNQRDISFIVDSQGRQNIWTRNYFDKKVPFLPKAMIGILITPFFIPIPPGGKIQIQRPKLYFDWYPSLIPYNIRGL